MRTGIIAVASVVALLGGVAMAQTSPGGAPGGARPPGAATAPSAAPKQPAVNPLTQDDVSKIKGTNVYGSDDKKIGDVSTVLMDPKNKTIDRLVVGSGGVLGVGGHHVALPVSDFSWDSQHEAFKISKSGDDLKSMPEWKDTATASAATAPSAGSSSPPANSAPASAAPAAAPGSAPAASDAAKDSSSGDAKK